MDGEVAVVPFERVVEVDDALHELRLEEPHAAEIEEVDRLPFPHGVIAEMGIGVDHAVAVEGNVPGAE